VQTYNDFDSNSLVLEIARLRIVRVLAQVVLAQSLDRDADRVRAEFLIFFVFLNLESITSPHLLLPGEEGLSLAVDRADEDLALTF